MKQRITEKFQTLFQTEGEFFYLKDFSTALVIDEVTPYGTRITDINQN